MKNNKHQMKSESFNSEQPYVKTVLYIILVASCATTGVATLAGLFMKLGHIEIGISIIFVFSAIMLWFTYKNKLWVPRLLVPSIAYAIATFIAWTNNGIRDVSMFIYPITILLAGMIIGEKGVILYTVMIILTVTWIGYAEITQQISTPFSQYNSIDSIVFLDVLLLTIGAILFVTIDNLYKSLNRAQSSEMESAERYQELQDFSASLEQQVTERTRSAQEAQEQVEKANRRLEQRMWQFAGRTHLSEMIRGEQDVPTLAHNVIRGLCEFLEAPIGALFILESSILKLAGGYAYPQDDEDAPVSFDLGEGVIGQAALENRAIRISDLPADYIQITSGLGKAAVRHIFAVPFMNENHIVGVIEIGSFTELYPEQISLVESTLNDIAIAFSTAQARTRIDELLRETQQMAEELQTQEEELRAANEELAMQTERLRESYTKLERQVDEEVN